MGWSTKRLASSSICAGFVSIGLSSLGESCVSSWGRVLVDSVRALGTIKLGPTFGREVVASALRPFHPRWYFPWSILLVVCDQYPLNFGSSSHSSQYQESLMNSTGL